MQEAITTKDKLTSLMLQMQDIIMEDYEDNADIQDAFNALASAFDYYIDEE
jgi:protein-arginine kinase activator protein McsA